MRSAAVSLLRAIFAGRLGIVRCFRFRPFWQSVARDPGPRQPYPCTYQLALLAVRTDQHDRRAVMYEALPADEWYCKGGYLPRLLGAGGLLPSTLSVRRTT
jgi:hypothetical protein